MCCCQNWSLIMFSGSIAVILPKLDLWIVLAVLPQYCQKGLLRQYCQKLICMWNPVLRQYCGSIARTCCSNIAAIGCQRPCILVRENLFALLYYEKFGWGIKKKLPAVYCKLTFVAKNLIGPLSCDCKNACVFHSRQQIWRTCWHNNFWQQINILWLFLIKALDGIKKYMFL